MSSTGTPAAVLIGIDLGGTKIEGAAFQPDGAERARTRVATPREDYAATVRAIADLVLRLESAANAPASVGVGMPGSISPRTGLVQNANSTWLNGRHFDRDLSLALGRPVRLANDANCFALSEALDGAGAGARSVFGVILGTGCGGGIVIDGRLVDGPRGAAGEWGHNPLPWPASSERPGPRCWCGERGCLETWVSGPALERDHAHVTGETLSVEEIAHKAAAGNTLAEGSLERHASRLARGLAAVVNILDPDVIVLGGGLSKLDHLYRVLPTLIAPYVFSDTTEVEIRAPRWGDAGGVRGAAWLWREW
jgi:fructokinase